MGVDRVGIQRRGIGPAVGTDGPLHETDPAPEGMGNLLREIPPACPLDSDQPFLGSAERALEGGGEEGERQEETRMPEGDVDQGQCFPLSTALTQKQVERVESSVVPCPYPESQ